MTFIRRELEADGFAIAAARILRDEVAEAIDRRQVCHLALSGGKTPWLVLHQLADHELDWARVHLWQVDEQVVPAGHPDRYATGLEGSLIARNLLPSTQIHLMDVDSPDLEAAAADYARRIDDVAGGILDVVHLGIGTEGQTASWFPGDRGVEIQDRSVAVLRPAGHHVRMSLTIPCVNTARRRLFVISGSDKVGVLERLIAGDDALPASRIVHENTLILDDVAGRTF